MSSQPERERLLEDQLEQLLSSASPPAGASDEERRLHAFLSACKETARSTDASARLVERSIAATTREDLSWRGDVRDTARFVRDRLRSSGLMRLAAASLLLHLAALPVVGLYMLAEEPEPPRFFVETGPRDAPYEDGARPEPEEGLDIAEPELVNELLVQNSLRWGRYQLEMSKHRLPGEKVRLPSWLAQRFEVLYRGVEFESMSAGSCIPEPVLAMELLLDESLVKDSASSDSKRASVLLDALSGLLDLGDDDAWLIASALARAESYGLSTPLAADALRGARLELSQEDPRRALIEVHGDVRAVMPLDITWLNAASVSRPGCLGDETLDLFRPLSHQTPR